jgi:hypothetical protein
MSIELAAAAVALIAPYLTEAGKEAAKTTGKETTEAGLRLLGWMREKRGGRAKEALTELEEKPDSQLNRDDLRTQLAKLLEKQPELMPELRKLLSDAQTRTSSLTQNVGAGGQGVQIEGTQNKASISVKKLEFCNVGQRGSAVRLRLGRRSRRPRGRELLSGAVWFRRERRQLLSNHVLQWW